MKATSGPSRNLRACIGESEAPLARTQGEGLPQRIRARGRSPAGLLDAEAGARGPRRTARLLCVLGVAVALLVIGPTTPVEAGTEHATHTGHGVVTVEARHPRPGNAIHYVVRLTWSADGHPATGAVVTAAPVSPSGVPGPAVRLTPLDGDGRYGGTIRFNQPGTWTITVSAGRPQTSAVIHERRS